ncbi:efflux transporter periplasmic adaptor subunit [Rhodobacter sp. TJ_12]|uniref:efflux RND transporter periplasmic adaptor subunit n=1 Tax=Rhodobacter sp. TJ_12 TaxID=2029399 RepID=UPI001CBB9F97|nr:efflux RND transporter periplasmic adaptor subunit [Rhodobacter sp. TJ_12]MBZ4021199.1 efflux transporter periplasmic adaptor subunit [Rhodobacter sp. TJ_12]
MRFLFRSLTGLFLAALTIALLAAGGFTMKSALDARKQGPARMRAAQERVFAANVIALEFAARQPELTAYGAVRTLRELELRAPAAGTLMDLSPNFVEGGQVAAGEVLARLDPVEALANRDSAAASKAEAEAQLALAERGLTLARDDLTAAERQAELRRAALERQRAIDEKGFGTTANIETAELAVSAAEQAVVSRRSALSSAEAALDQARNALRRAEIALSEAQRKLDETEIRAEFTGQLSGVETVAGRLVSNNEILGTLIDPSALEVSFRVPTAQFARLTDETGALRKLTARVTLDLGQDHITVPATLERAGAAVEEGQAGRLLFARLMETRGLKAGDFVTVTLAMPMIENVALLPAAAVGPDGKVLVLGPEERLQAEPVDVVHRQGDDVLIRAAGLQSGQEVVAERTPLLGEGLKLRPLRAATDGAALVPQKPEQVTLDADRRARLIAAVEGNPRMPAEAKARMLATLQQDQVPADLVARIESRMGG